MRAHWKTFLLAGLALLLAVGLKIWLVGGGWVPFNADEAVVALMARHIMQGARPVFFYGQAYMGSLDAFLVAGAFALFGQQIGAIRLVQSFLYLGTLASTAWLGKMAFGSWRVGALAMLLLAVPTVNVTLYTTASLGGYGEALLIGNLILICGLRIGEQFSRSNQPGSFWLWGILGFLSGLGLWAFSLCLIYSMPVALYLFILLGRWVFASPAQAPDGAGKPSSASTRFPAALVALAALAAGGLVGSAPWGFYALQHGISTLVKEMGGGAIAGVEHLPWLRQSLQHFFNLALLGSTVALGFRPPWDIYWLAFPLLPFVFLFWMAVIAYSIKELRKPSPLRAAQAVLVGVIGTLLLAFIFTPFGADPSGRYFVPLAIPMTLFAAAMILDLEKKVGVWAYGVVLLLLVFNFWGTLQSALRFPPGITTQFYAPTQVDHRYDQELIAFLRQQGESRGYGNYWIAYPLAFLSGEQMIFVPRLPYHLDFRYTARDDRFAPYDAAVAASPRVAYITSNHPDLDKRLRDSFSALGVQWQEAGIGSYTVFYHLSRPVRPQEIGLGETTQP